MVVMWSNRYSVRRAIKQRGIVGAVAAVAVTATMLIGICTLLLTATADRGFVEAVDRAQTTLQLTVPAGDSPHTRLEATTAQVEDLFAPIPVTQDFWATTQMAYLPSDQGSRIGYVGVYQDVTQHATLVDGRWAAAGGSVTGQSLEVAMPTEAAGRFGVQIGDSLTLNTPSGDTILALTIVGTYQAIDPGGEYWSHDLLAGKGFDPAALVLGQARPRFLPTSGAFLAADAAFVNSGVPFETIEVAATPTVAGSTPDDIARAAAKVGDARAVLREAVAPEVTAFSSFAEAVYAATRHAKTTRDIVVIALLMVAALSVIALVLASSLLGHRRRADNSLLESRGASGAQMATAGVGEALVLGTVAAVLGPGMAWVGYTLLIRVPLAADAGLTAPATLSPTLWVTCGTVAGFFALLIVVVGARTQSTTVRPARRGALARSGLDIALVVVAALGVAQLTLYGTPAAGGRLDIVLALTPVLCLAAGAALTVRAVPAIGHLADRWLPARRGLLAPLAIWDTARRPQRTSGAVFLLTFAIAAASFAPGFISTWRLSQHDQADLAVGADVRVDNMAAATAMQGALIAATAGSEPSPVARSHVALGTGGSTVATQQRAELLAVDASRPDLLRGRLDTGTWDSLLAPLDSQDIAGPELPGEPLGISMTTTGTIVPVDPYATAEDVAQSILGTFTVMLRDARGATWPVSMPTFPLDGGTHTTTASISVDPAAATSEISYPLTVDAIVAHLSMAGQQYFSEELQYSQLQLDVASVTGVGADDVTAGPLADADWTLTIPQDSYTAFLNPELSAASPGAAKAGQSLSVTTTLAGGDIDRGGIDMILTPWEAPTETPVVISAQLADDISADVGSHFFITVPGGGSVKATVTAISPYLPSLPREPSILADLETFTRASIADGAPDAPMTGWQLSVTGGDEVSVVAALRDAKLDTATSRAHATAGLLDSPSRVGVQLAAVLVAAAAVLLGVAGFALHLSGSLDQRRFEFARLYGVGLSRRLLAATVALQAALLALVAGAFGLGIGSLTNALVSRHLAVSEAGEVPIPAASTAWPWLVELAVVGGIGIVLTAVALVAAQSAIARVRRDVLGLGDDS